MLTERAEEFAKLVHRNQSYGELPYYVHLKEVYLTLLDFGVTDENILAASWLHDSIEDTSTTYETLLIQFGKEVADLVNAVTNEKGISRKEILEKTAPKIRDNEAALVIKLADRIVNTEFSIDNNEKLYKMYEKEFPRFRELLYDDNNYSIIPRALWYYLEDLYSGKEELMFDAHLALDMAEAVFELHKRWNEIISEEGFDEREDKYYDKCYELVEEKMYDQ